ncbi:NusB antitermination factor [Thermodesulfobium narugense DSM 14796]|uniref:Transcription antitermination protein NusB n=1 Tax=Thermodesulfobium narugense DSM 14796 TaxID=747365 RepID=M1E5X4_9BACT|nr:transcription antitermination factor NusB [Thermodesulfobium narugense]AEE13770.1 NusB antitermination factor [Thermodesulfobium narugense DSM 14796]
MKKSLRYLREMVLKILYELEINSQSTINVLMQRYAEHIQPEDFEFIRVRAEGIIENKDAIDKLLDELSIDWPTERMVVTDRLIMEIAVFEMNYLKLSPSIAINEAVELSKLYGTEKSYKFVNAVLSKVANISKS